MPVTKLGAAGGSAHVALAVSAEPPAASSASTPQSNLEVFSLHACAGEGAGGKAVLVETNVSAQVPDLSRWKTIIVLQSH